MYGIFNHIEEQVNWDLESDTGVDDKFTVKLSCPDSESANNKWELMGLDEHLQASTAAGIIDKYRGASNYLNDKTNPYQASRVLVLKVKCKKERLNLQHLSVDGIPHLVETTKATHIIVGITYGVEAYCVLTQDLDNNVDDEETREEANDNLSDLAAKLINALEDTQNVSEFQGQFNKEEKQRLTKMKCRLYADCQSQAVKECSVFDVYKHCLKLIEIQQSEAIPISILLCPLKRVINNPTRSITKILQYRDVDVEMVQRICCILADLARASGEAEAVRSTINKNSRASLRSFIETISKFQDILKKNLKGAISKVRGSEEGDGGDDELADIVNAAERHLLFKPKRLERWLEYKKAEAEILEKMNKTKGINLFTSLKSLTNELADSDKKYALVLIISPVDQRTKDITAKMKVSLKSNAMEITSDSEEDEDGKDEEGIPWHMITRKRKQVLDKIRELADYAEKNKHLENQVQFLMAIGDSDKGLCRYSVYEFDNVLKENIVELPGPPTGLKFQRITKTAKKSGSIRVEWTYQDLGYPTHFMVEYRSKDDNEFWNQKKTANPGDNHVTINLKDESALEIRVASDTCIGRSEFSSVVSTETDELDDESNEEEEPEPEPAIRKKQTPVAHRPPVTETNTEPVRPPRKADRMPGSIKLPGMTPPALNKGVDRKDWLEMTALGRRFELGNLYDYRNDRITGNNLNFAFQIIILTIVIVIDDWLEFEYSHQVDENFTLKLDVAESTTKWEVIGLDEHSKASTMAGLIDKFVGASNYLNDKTSSSQVSRVLVLRAVTRKEHLNLLNTIDCEVVKSNATQSTHLVVGATYGAEAYCVMFQDDKENGENARDNLSNLSDKLVRAIRANQNWEDLQEQFNREEKECLKLTKCRLYSDCQSQAVKECNVVDAYKHCLQLIEQVQQSEVAPISVSLCPLKRLIGPAKGAGSLLQYQDVDGDLVSRCCRIWAELERASGEAEVLRDAIENKNSRASLRSFVEAIDKFKHLLKKGLKTNLVKARETGDEDEIKKIVDIVEKHPLFKPSGLNRWLEYKKAELEMAEKFKKTKGITILASKKEMGKELGNSFDMRFALVMWIPPLDGKTKEILEAMTVYVESYTKLVKETTHKEDEDEKPWHMDGRKCKQIQDKIRQFSDYVNKNKQLEDQVNFFAAFGDKFECRYSVYEGDQVLKDNLEQLPGPPNNLRIQQTPPNKARKSPSISVLWDYEDFGYPVYFVVQYKVKGEYGDENWKQQKTLKSGETQLTINIQPGSVMEVRVAADTCVGRSEFSDVVDTESGPIDDESIEDDVENISLKSEQEKSIFQQYLPVRQVKSPAEQNPVEYNPIQKEPQIFAPKQDYPVQRLSPQPPIQTTTKGISRGIFTEIIRNNWRRTGERNGLELYAVPLTKTSKYGAKAERFAFGKPIGKRLHKTILVMGATGSGKTTLINGMMNYIFNVQWSDPFRLQLIQEKEVGQTQSNSQTSHITAYDIHYLEGFRLPYSLTIVDTPGYGDSRGLDRDQEITEMVRNLFEDQGGIQDLDVVGFVVSASLARLTPTQMYIFDSVLSIFGKDVKENIKFMLTFADSQNPPVLNAIAEANLPCLKDQQTGQPLHHKFNNSGFFCSNDESSSSSTVGRFNKFFWQMGMENFDKFFNVLATMNTKSLSLTKQVLEERKHLEATVDGLQPLIKAGLTKIEEMRKLKLMVTNSQAQIEANRNVKFEFEVTVAKKKEVPLGTFLTNCNKCSVTCHYPCAYQNDDDKVDCAAMDWTMPAASRSCTVCPKNCIWTLHANQPYRWEYVMEKQATTSEDIKAKYEKELNRKLSSEDLIKALQDALEVNEREVLKKVEKVTKSIARLETIALRPNPFSTPQYIDMIIEDEMQKQQPGYLERIESWRKLRNMADITNKVINKISLFENRK